MCSARKPNSSAALITTSHPPTAPLVNWLYSHAAGAIMPNLNNSVMQRLSVYHPDLDRQHEIVNAFSVIDKKTVVANCNQAILQDLFRAFLHELMAAKIRIGS